MVLATFSLMRNMPTLDLFLLECDVVVVSKKPVECNISKEEKERILNEFSKEAGIFQTVDNEKCS